MRSSALSSVSQSGLRPPAGQSSVAGTRSRGSWFVPLTGTHPEAIHRALAWLSQLASTDPLKRDCVMAIPGKRNLTGDITESIGEGAATALSKGQQIRIGNATFHLWTEKTWHHSWRGPILAVFPGKSLLDKVDGTDDVTDVVVVPWQTNELDSWIAGWQAAEIGTSRPSAPRPLALDPRVVAVLTHLGESINKSTGVANSSDRATVIATFRRFLQDGIDYDPTEVRSWLVGQDGWEPRHADDVQKIAQTLRQGGRLRG